METKQIIALIKKIDRSKEKISAEKDILREYLTELESLLDSFDRGIEAIDDGTSQITRGIDALSEQI